MGGEKRGENNEGSGSALWGNGEAAAIPSAWAWGRGAAVPSRAPARSGVPQSPPAWPGAQGPHSGARVPARHIPYTFSVLPGSWIWDTSRGGEERPRDPWVVHRAGAGSERSALSRGLHRPPRGARGCCGCRGGRAARWWRLRAPRGAPSTSRCPGSSGRGELCGSQRCGNLKRRWLGTRLHERWHWGGELSLVAPPPLGLERQIPLWLPLKAIPNQLLQPWRGRRRGGGTTLSLQGPVCLCPALLQVGAVPPQHPLSAPPRGVAA